MTPVKNWTALRTSGVARKMESTAASAMRITRDLMLSPLVRSNLTTNIVITNGTTAININRCWIEVYYIPPSLFSHITLPLTLFNSFHLFLSSPVSQTLWSTVPAAQAPCLCLAASCLKQASRLTPSTSTTPAATAHSKMAEWSSSSTMRITLVEPLWGYNSFYTKDLQNKLFFREVLSWSVNLWAKPKWQNPQQFKYVYSEFTAEYGWNHCWFLPKTLTPVCAVCCPTEQQHPLHLWELNPGGGQLSRWPHQQRETDTTALLLCLPPHSGTLHGHGHQPPGEVGFAIMSALLSHFFLVSLQCLSPVTKHNKLCINQWLVHGDWILLFLTH